MVVGAEDRRVMEAEYRALRAGCGISLGPPLEVLALSGEDRGRFLNGQLTCDVRRLAPGEGAYGFFPDIKGKILSEVVVRVLEDRFVLALPAGRGEAIRQHLLGYVIVDRVEVGSAEPLGCLDFRGPESERCLADLLGTPPPAAPWRHREVQVEDVRARVSALGIAPGGAGAEGWSLLVARDAAERLFERWRSTEPPAGALTVGPAASESRRVESGRLRFGVDYGSDHFPQESGREDAVSYDKGCYLGQEVIARIHYRGGVNRVPRGLLFSSQEAPTEGAALRFEGREVGHATSVAWSPGLGRPVGLALLHRRGAEPGSRLEIDGGEEAEVAELPLVAEPKKPA